MTLSPRWIFNGIDLTDAPYMVEMDASDHGAPESVRSVLASMLADGDVDLIDRHTNRTFEIHVVIEGDLSVVADAEAALVTAAMRERGTLVFEPGDGSAAASVFETFAADVVLPQSESEDDAGLRRVRLSIPARPFARPLTPLTIDAPPVVGSTTTSVDSGSSTTGWSVLSTRPATTTNLEIDPSITGLGGWAAGAGASSAVYDTGIGDILVNRPDGAASRFFVNSRLYTVVAGRFYQFGWTLYGPFSNSPRTFVRWFSDAAATTVISEATYNGPAVTSGDIKTPTLQAPPGAVRAQFYPNVVSASAFGVERRWVNECTVAAELFDGYFDGNTTDTAAVNYGWSGTANASTSTATWSVPTLVTSGGSVRATVYGRSSVTVRRSGAVSMSTLPYMRITGTNSAVPGGQVTVADNGSPVAPMSYSYNQTTGAQEILLNRPTGFTAIDLTFTAPLGQVSTTSGLTVAVDQIDITNNPFATGKTQTRQVRIYGSQRTELSLSVLGLDAAGTTPTGLGEQVLVYTASAGDDGRAKFLACRAATGLGGTADSTAASGAWSALGPKTAPTSFTFPASTLLTGTYMAMTRVRSSTVGSSDLSLRAFVDPTVGDNAYDPRTGWKTAPFTVASTGAVWPSANTNTGVLIPIGLLRLPPADVEDAGATITVQLACGANAVDVDDLFLMNTDVGQASLLLTGLTSGSYSAVRLDAATVDAAQASAWVGVANGTMIADAARWIGEQHAAAPGLLQIATVTPGCATSRVSAHYFPRFHTHVASVDTAAA